MFYLFYLFIIIYFNIIDIIHSFILSYARLFNYSFRYDKINELVDQIFPPINIQINNDFNDYNYWRSPIPDFDIDLSIIESSLPTDNKKQNNNSDKNNNKKPELKKELSTESILTSSLSEEMDDETSSNSDDDSKSESDSEYLSSDKFEPIHFNDNQNADRKLIIRNFTDGDPLIEHSEAESNSPEDLKPLLNHGHIVDYPTISISKDIKNGYEEEEEEEDRENDGENDGENENEEENENIHNNHDENINKNENGGIRINLGIKTIQNRRSIRDFIRRRRGDNNNNNVDDNYNNNNNNNNNNTKNNSNANKKGKKNKNKESSSEEEEEIEIEQDYRPLDDNDPENEEDEDDGSIQISKDDITAYIDDLLVKEDPTEKLDLAAYPYL